jgi:hypothetical protein
VLLSTQLLARPIFLSKFGQLSLVKGSGVLLGTIFVNFDRRYPAHSVIFRRELLYNLNATLEASSQGFHTNLFEFDMMAWRSNHQAVYCDPSLPFSTPPCHGSSGAAYPSPTGPSPTRSTYFSPAPAINIPHTMSKKVVQVRCAKKDEVKGWLDAMKAQSPPRYDAVSGAVLDAQAQENAAAAKYASWKVRIHRLRLFFRKHRSSRVNLNAGRDCGSTESIL